MDEVRIEVADDGSVRTITINRPEKRNALTRDMFARLTEAFEAKPPARERVTVLQAEGPSFCAGVDLDQRADNETRPGHSPLELLCDAMWRYPLPVVAAVQGAAIGGGFMLAMQCDFVIAVDDAKLGNTSAQLALVPHWATMRRLSKRTGPTLARELLLLGNLVPAQRLADAQAITKAVPRDDLRGEVDRVVARLAQNAPLSLRAVKATLAAQPHDERAHEVEDALLERARHSDDSAEGVRARSERRPPQYQGT